MPGQLFEYDHTGKKTPFSRWLAVNRKRHGKRFRHTARRISEVQFARTGRDVIGVAAFDTGKSLTYFRTQGSASQTLMPQDVPALPANHYLLWIFPG